jgi:NDP-sugar pyrophosphorylase family protein
MKIDYCLILAAGFGTRMGVIGQKLPKVLWPIFEKNLLHLQILYAKKLGIKKIFINLHHQKDQIKTFLTSLNDESVILLEEDPEILDIGGGVHNLARHPAVNYQGNLLILNSDQFLLFSKDQFEQGVDLASRYGACLFAISVHKSGKYNQTIIDQDGFLEKIVPEKNVVEENFWTYSGISIVELGSLEKSSGASKFFETVAPFQKRKVPNVKLTQISYWDFGTLQRYHASMFDILNRLEKNTADDFIEFLIAIDGLKLSKVKKNSYFSDHEGVINLSAQKISASNGSIILSKTTLNLPADKSVVVFEEVLVELT